MANEFRLPDIGEGLTEAEIVRWLIDEGERVESDQPIVEVETDKAVVEIPSPYAGVVLKHGGAVGEVIEVGSVLVTIGEPDETQSEDVSTTSQPDGANGRSEPSSVFESEPASATASVSSPTDLSESSSAAPIVGTLSEEAEVLSPRGAASSTPSMGVKALPVVRKLARDNDVDLASISGSGPDGRITREDVEAAIEAASSPSRSGDGATGVSIESDADDADIQAVPKAVSRDDERRRMSRLRRTIADNMAKSWSEIPHVTTFDDVDATRLLEIRSALSHRHEIKLPLEALVVKAVLPALDEFPEFNSTIDGEDLILHGSRDIGIAVDTDEGLMVAVIKDAADKSVLQLAQEVVRLGEGARARKLGPNELSGQTFTVSNIGAVGGGHGTPIVPHGTTAILSVGRAKEQAIVHEGDLVIAPVMPLSLSYDHRVIDGGTGRRFMSLIMENLAEPALFLAS